MYRQAVSHRCILGPTTEKAFLSMTTTKTTTTR